MISSIIVTIFSNLTAKEKLLLIMLAAYHQPTEDGQHLRVIEEGGTELSQRFGLSKATTFGGLSKLRKMGILEEHSDQGGVGRPRKYREIIPYSWETLERRTTSLSVRLPAVANTLVRQRLQGANQDLGAVEFLLLLVLVVFSDERGVITQLSHRDLNKLTRIPHPQIRRRLSQLRDKGWIKAVAPGLVEGRLLGKANTIYYLSLGSALFEKTGISIEEVELPRDVYIDATAEVRREMQSASHPLRSPSTQTATVSNTGANIGRKSARIDGISWKIIAPSLLERESVRIYLQRGVERYASLLLDNPRSILGNASWIGADDLATSEFMSTLLNVPPAKIASTPSDSFDLRRLCTDLEQLSHNLAESVRLQLMAQQAKQEQNHAIHRILPPSMDTSGTFVVEKITLPHSS